MDKSTVEIDKKLHEDAEKRDNKFILKIVLSTALIIIMAATVPLK